ncbi:hypothetical protein AVEN_249576-1 [Araneus ventricosus]|uniref:Uncharacterized protein n=1 Tax=Araneus ventricosus TaxID=182803 RepID=A0A4Y2MDE1_ARAVE|nr:hypothetical protein AVEN_249576-1 [Araneus ventricosus]
MPSPPTVSPIVVHRDSHVLLLRPNKTSSSEENKKIIETAVVKRNSASRISKITKVNQGGLIIEAPTDPDLQALEAEIHCISKRMNSRPKRRKPQNILLGIDNEVDKDLLTRGVIAKNYFFSDTKNNPLVLVNFPIRARRNTNWVTTLVASIYKRLFDESGLFFEFSRFRFGNFFAVKQCRLCRRFEHTTK